MSNSTEETNTMLNKILKTILMHWWVETTPFREAKNKVKAELVDSEAPKFVVIQRVSNKFVLRFFFDRCPEHRGQGFSA